MIPAEWHQDKQKHLIERYRLGNLPHAVLIYGEEGIGKLASVNQICQSLLCQKPIQYQACNECPSCKLYLGQTHPNVSRLAPEKNLEKKTQSPIKIDEIRELSSKLVMTSQYSGPNIAIIEQADTMNHFAANALLKTLEEPTPNTLIFLVTHQTSRLLATIRSRCQSYLFNKPKYENSMAWLKSQSFSENKDEKELQQALQLAKNAPLKALNYLNESVIEHRGQFINSLSALFNNQASISQTADLAKQLDFILCIKLLQSLLNDIVRLHHLADESQIQNKDLLKNIRQILKSTSLHNAYVLVDKLNNILQIYNASINSQLMLESFLASWHNMAMLNLKTA